MFIDISDSIASGLIHPGQCEKRCIGSKSRPAQLQKYQNYINKQFLHHNIFQKAEVLYNQANNEVDQTKFAEELNKLDSQVTIHVQEEEILEELRHEAQRTGNSAEAIQTNRSTMKQTHQTFSHLQTYLKPQLSGRLLT